jgi:hypothetical protein
MAIAADSSLSKQSGVGVTSLTYSFNNVAGNFLVVAILTELTLADIVSVTYNGVTMTNASSQAGETTRTLWLYYLASPATGANNVVITVSPADNITAWTTSYTGVNTSSPQDTASGVTNASTNTLTYSPTTGTDNDWAVAMVRGAGGTVTGNTNLTALFGADSFRMLDSAGSIGAAGAKTISADGAGGPALMYGAFMTFKPGGATPIGGNMLLMGVG